MPLKKKYTTLDELKLAQKRMAQQSTQIEQEFLGVIQNPLSILIGPFDSPLPTGDTKSNNTRSTSKVVHAKERSASHTSKAALLSEHKDDWPQFLLNTILPLIPTKKIGQMVANSAVKVLVRVAIGHLVIMGGKALIDSIPSKYRKKNTRIVRK